MRSPTWRRMRGVGIACLWEQGEVMDEAKEVVVDAMLVIFQPDGKKVFDAEQLLQGTRKILEIE